MVNLNPVLLCWFYNFTAFAGQLRNSAEPVAKVVATLSTSRKHTRFCQIGSIILMGAIAQIMWWNVEWGPVYWILRGLEYAETMRYCHTGQHQRGALDCMCLTSGYPTRVLSVLSISTTASLILTNPISPLPLWTMVMRTTGLSSLPWRKRRAR